jgi:hypothetical protein
MPPRQKGKVRSLRGMRYVAKDDFKIVKMPGALRDWKIKCVCGGTHKTCNNGWMRERIENTARPILTALIKGEAVRLSPYHQERISAWAVLKAMVSEFDIGSNVSTDQIQRDELMRTHLPPEDGWAVWIANFERGNWLPEWVSIPLCLIPNPPPELAGCGKITIFWL